MSWDFSFDIADKTFLQGIFQKNTKFLKIRKNPSFEKCNLDLRFLTIRLAVFYL